MRLVIIGCGKSKIWDKNPWAGPQKASNVYVGPYFKAKRRFAESRGCDWMILSGKYGFVRPDFIIPQSYNATFNRPSTCPISVQELRQQVEERGLSRYDEITVLGGGKYIEKIRDAFCDTRARIETPFAGYPMGQQMHMINHLLGKAKLAQEEGSEAAVPYNSVSCDRAKTEARPGITVNADTFRNALKRILNESKGSLVDVTSGELHRLLGGYPGKHHNLTTCCNVMTKAMQPGDRVLASPPGGRGATLKIRYVLPRKNSPVA